MGHATRSMLEMSAACLLFLLAAGSGLWLFQTGAALTDAAYLAEGELNRSLQQSFTPIAGDGRLSGSEVFHLIAHLEDEDVELVVDGARYSDPIERVNWLPSRIRMSGRYQINYDRNPNGDLLRIHLASS